MASAKVAKTFEIPQGTMKRFEIEGNGYLIVNFEGNYYALCDRCSHLSAHLSQGTLNGRIITCPKHHASFDVVTGRAQQMHTSDIEVYRVTVEGDDILIDYG